MGNRPYQYSVYGNKRRRLEPIRQQMLPAVKSTSNDSDNGNYGFFGFITRFIAPMTNLFRPSVKSLRDENIPYSAGDDDDVIIIEQENSVLRSLVPKKDLCVGRNSIREVEDKENEKDELAKDFDLDYKVLFGKSRRSLNASFAKPTFVSDKDFLWQNSLDQTLEYGSPSPQPEHSISRQNSPSVSRAGSGVSLDKWERRRTSSSARNALLFSRYSPYKAFSSGKVGTSEMGHFDRRASVVDREGKERYRKFLEEAGIFKASIVFSGRSERKRLPKKTDYLELLQRGQSALNSVSQSGTSSVTTSRKGSTTTNSSNDIPVAEEKASSDSEFIECSNCTSVEGKHSENCEEVGVIWDTKHRDDFKALWEEEKNTKQSAEHRLAHHRRQASLRDRRAKELRIQKRLIEEARRDEELSLEEQLRKKLTLTGYIFRSRKAKDEFPELDDEAVLLVERAWDRKLPLDEKLSGEITRKDLLTLKGLDWLNDEVINFYMNLICERAKNDENLPRVYAFSSFFYSTLSGKGYTSVRRWTRKIDIFSYEMLLVPVHLGAHWCLAVIDFKNRIIDYYDSMGGSNDRCLDILSEYLCEESLDKRKNEFDLSDWQLVNREDIPQQMNGSDCGMFACKFAEYVTRRAQISFSQEHMPYFRERMVYEICQKKLL
uniref:Ubiquitin-like protease family profile domain-containing protein n=1 Tax=Setaria digitata TaxID=48799 RepID=A0A915PK57_9BILA